MSLAGLLSAGHRVLLVFTDPRCGPCQALLPTVTGWQDAHSGGLTVALISRGGAAENMPARDEHGLGHVGLQAERETDAQYGVLGTPSAILIAANGSVARPLVVGAERIAEIAQDLPAETLLEPAFDGEQLSGQVAIELRSPEANSATRLRPAARSATGLAAGVAALSASAAAAPAAFAAGGEHAAAGKIAGELGDLIRKIAPETFAASQALRGARITTPGKPIRVPTAALMTWHRRVHDIDQAHANISRVHGADAARKAALDALSVLRAACRDGELALTSSTASKRNHYAKQQQAADARLHAAIHTLTGQLHKAGATHL